MNKMKMKIKRNLKLSKNRMNQIKIKTKYNKKTKKKLYKEYYHL